MSSSAAAALYLYWLSSYASTTGVLIQYGASRYVKPRLGTPASSDASPSVHGENG